jgi:hypothetical protein
LAKPYDAVTVTPVPGSDVPVLQQLVPIDSMPAWAQSLAWFSPLLHSDALFRELFGTFGTDKLAALGRFV